MVAVLAVVLTAGATRAADPPADKPWLGVGILRGVRGVRVLEVIESTPAEVAGLKTNDEIISVAGKRVIDPNQLIKEIQQHGVGDDVELLVIRDRKKRTIIVTLSRFPTPEELMQRRLVGKRAPPFILRAITGKASGNLEDHLGDVVLLEFWGIWNTDSTGLLDKIGDISSAKAKSGLVVLGISSDSHKKQKEFLTKTRVAFTLLLDSTGRLFRQDGGYSIPDFPAHIVIDRDGMVVHASVGTDLDSVEFAIGRALRDRNGVKLD